jgi:hypothetical protein
MIIIDPAVVSTLALITGIIAIVNVAMIVSNFLYFRRKRAFIEYLNNKLSKGSDNGRNR